MTVLWHIVCVASAVIAMAHHYAPPRVTDEERQEDLNAAIARTKTAIEQERLVVMSLNQRPRCPDCEQQMPTPYRPDWTIVDKRASARETRPR